MQAPPTTDSPPRAAPHARGWTQFENAVEPIGDDLITRPPAARVLDGRFEIGELLGIGGSSCVYACKDLAFARDGLALESNAAIKILKEGSEEARRRFLDEARILVGLRHPHLVQVLAVGETDAKAPYMVLERLAGQDLGERLRREGPLPWREVVEIVAQVASAVEALHEASVIHRDVKPSNIVRVTSATARPFVKLIDLGTAKVNDWLRVQAGPVARHQTDAGMVVGTVGFCPPEAGLEAPAPRFDVFGLGVTIYQLCTGEVPSVLEYRPMSAVRPGCAPPELEALVGAALAARAEDRIATASEIQRRLETIRVAHFDDSSPFLFDGCYELIELLGVGAKAEVYRAYQRDSRRYCALKILREEHCDDAVERLRFAREAQVLSAVQHPALPTLSECRTGPKCKRPYIAMSLMRGKAARDLYDGGKRMAPADVIAVGKQLAGALAALHARGILHRDVYGRNVLIDVAARGTTAALIDVGMADLEDRFYATVEQRYPTPPEARVKLRSGGLEGLPWTAPEASAGKGWTARSDVYSLGLLLYQLLTSKRPRASKGEDAVAPRSFVPSCPPALSWALLNTLDEDPKQRMDMTEFMGRLDTAADELAEDDEDDEDDEVEEDVGTRTAATAPDPAVMLAIWHPPRQAPNPELISFELPEELSYDYSGEILDGRYQLDKPIGPGGTSTVYGGMDLRTGAKIAVKILYASMHKHLLGLFGQEGRVAARHTCPHLVQAIDFGKHEDCAFTVFKFVHGVSLFHLGLDNPLPWRRVVRIGIQILAALDDLHTRGLVHCDLHPSNILVHPDLEGLDFAVVIDLGFAFVIPPKRITNAPAPTRFIFGLPRFIAPERRAGDAPGPRSDLYSLGVLLWELLTAQILPAYGLDPGLAIPPVRTIAPGLDIPEALDVIIMRALSDVEYRFCDAQEMAQALRAVLEPTSPPVFAAPSLPLAAAAAGATLPAATVAADPAPPPSMTSPTPTAAPLPATRAAEVSAGRVAPERQRAEPPARRRWTRVSLAVVLGVGVLGVVWRSIVGPLPMEPAAVALFEPANPPSVTAPPSSPNGSVLVEVDRPPAAPLPEVVRLPPMREALDVAEVELRRCAERAGGLLLVEFVTGHDAFAQVVVRGNADDGVERCVHDATQAIRFEPGPPQSFNEEYTP